MPAPVLPKRWIVERTFAWISRNRRLARDFERYATTVAAFIRLAMIRIMLRRLAALGWLGTRWIRFPPRPLVGPARHPQTHRSTPLSLWEAFGIRETCRCSLPTGVLG